MGKLNCAGLLLSGFSKPSGQVRDSKALLYLSKSLQQS